MTAEPMTIVQLTASNIKRLKAVTIRPDHQGNLVVLGGANGAGKQQPISEPVLTPTGWVAIGSIRPLDSVIGSNGRATKVLGVYPQEERRTYLVKFDDGASTRCGPDHLWTVVSWHYKNGGQQRVQETLTTSQILERGLRRSEARRFSVPLPAPIEFADSGVELPIDPYMLGVILGDGHIERTGYVTVTKDDREILDAAVAHAQSFWRGDSEVGTATWSRPLRHLGLAGKLSPEKFIPPEYLTASVGARRALLAGLLDTDGTAPDSWASYCTTSERLADDVTALARSLGLVCKKGNPVTKKYRYRGELKEGLPAWNLLIRSEVSPFTLPRKTAAWSVSEQRPVPRHFIDSIEQVGDEDSVCIQVAAEDGLYVTRDFILTHNTSVLDAITMALGGREQIPPEPIRRGAEHAEIVVDLGEIVVRRTFTASGGGSLTVSNKEGARFQSPQTLLDKLYGTLSFDPLAFARETGKRQAEILRQLVGLNTNALDFRREQLYAERTQVNKQAAGLRARVLAMPLYHGVPAEPVSVAEIAVELQAAMATKDANASVSRQAIRAADQVGERRRKVEQLRDQLAEAEASLQVALANCAKLEAQMAAQQEVDVAPLHARLAEADSVNLKVAANRQREALAAEADAAEGKSKGLSDEIESIDKLKAAAIADAKMPVPGLGFGTDGVTLNGLPLEQASGAERIRVSVAIGLAMNPRLRVLLIRDASLLDAASVQMVADMAKAAGAQIWLETVTNGNEDLCTVVIEDGEAREPR